SGSVIGKITIDDETIPGVSIMLTEINKGVVSDKNGLYKIDNIKPGSYTLRVSALGFKTIKDSITIVPSKNLERNYKLVEDVLNIGEIVVTGTRNEIERYNSPVIVNTISNRTFQATQSLSIAEGLSFSPGLRLENNCQNCGFTQLRMNGLEGPYSQVLINSRPVFSALAGVYGLEMLPANMVEKVEVVRGGGSVLYGGNAIAGTVNIITKDPIKNSFEASVNQAF
ncbi:TonB-dependent receptor, partial [Arthrospira platensis SPKY1]|nr:TonB-dependent receptor [Arthrospira platensis SPKY1]